MTAPRTAAPPPTTVSDATGPGGPVVIVTPWYPRPDKVYGGTFVREWVRALALPPDQVTVIHLEMVPVGDQRRPEDDIPRKAA
jgi:hypothetical protein